LANLIPLGVPILRSQIDNFKHTFLYENAMTAPPTSLGKSKIGQQLYSIRERNIFEFTSKDSSEKST
jgi:hypothetical protein